MKRQQLAVLTVILVLLTVVAGACAPAPAAPTAVPAAATAAKPAAPTSAPAAATAVPAAPTAVPAAPTTAATAAPKAPALAGKVSIMIHPVLYNVTGGQDGLIAKWSKATGVQVEVVTGQATEIREKVMIEGVAASGRFDVYPVQDIWMNEEIAKFLQPLDSKLASTGKEYRADDLIASLKQGYTVPKQGGQLYGIPWRIGTRMLYYRADLLKAAGVSVPKTMDEFYAAAKKLTLDTNSDGKIEQYGIVEDMFAGTNQLIGWIYANGGDLLTPDLKTCALNKAPAVAAVTMMSRMFQEGLIDKEALTWQTDPVIAALQTGRAAMTITYSPYWGLVTDPKGGDAAKNMGWATVPVAAGVPEAHGMNDGWAWAIDKASKNKDAAWALIEYLTNPENQMTMALDFANGPVRSSIYESDKYLAKFPLAKDWLKSAAASQFQPPHARFNEIRDILNQEATNAYQGKKTAQLAMDDACGRISPLLK